MNRTATDLHGHLSYRRRVPPSARSMGCGLSKEDVAGNTKSNEIENQIKRDALARRKEFKILLLGKASLSDCKAG